MKKLCVLAVFSFVIVYSGSVMALPMQWSLAVGGNDHWYDVVLPDPDPYLAWEDARDYANTAGGYLATITSPEENTFVSNLISSVDNDVTKYWLGGHQILTASEPDGNWAWVTGEVWSYNNWYPGEPNNGMGGTQHYLHYWPSAGQWDDMENGRYMAGYVIETPSPVPEPATMILFGTGLVGLVGARFRKRK